MSSPAPKTKPRVLFVDDEQRLLESIAVNLRKDYEVHIATSGDEALGKLAELRNVTVVVSDFRMPQMDGATFLHEVMARAPTATRILLTGEAGVDGARDAVNKGQIFRFLTKPCPTEMLKQALEEGVSQHRFLTAERAVMQETLIECISALMEVLAVTNPVAFGRAQRIKKVVTQLAEQLGLGQSWQLEAAALLSQLGYFAESPTLAEKIYYGRALTPAEQQRATVVSANAMRLLEHIPRLEPVIQILAALEWPDESIARAGDRMVGLGARILGVALQYDQWHTQGVDAARILEKLRARETRFGAKVLQALGAILHTELAAAEPETTMRLRDATPGMRLRDEVRTPAGALLVPIGFEISQRLLERLSQVAPEALDLMIRLAPARKG